MLQRFSLGFAVYTERRVWPLGLLGFSSGLPLLLTGGTLSAWLKESGLTLQSIGLFAWVGMLYTLKVLWSPAVDQLPLPLLSRRLGQRRAWMAVSQVGLMLSLAAMALGDPREALLWTATCAVAVAFFSATQDVAVDAFRVERAGSGQGEAAAIAIFGYRIGMLAASAGVLYLAEYWSWRGAYLTMAALMSVGLGATLGCAEPQRAAAAAAVTTGLTPLQIWQQRLHKAVVQPLVDFSGHRGWWAILLFAATFKLGDALAAIMTNPFLLEVGFTKPEIANTTKLFGLVATLGGAAIGGALVARAGVVRGLWIGGLLQAASLVVFALQALVGHHVWALAGTIGFEYAASAIGTAAFTAYLSGLCSARYTATQYALLTSLAALARSTLASSAGVVAKSLGWFPFFLFTAVAALPALGLLWYLQRRQAEPLVPAMTKA